MLQLNRINGKQHPSAVSFWRVYAQSVSSHQNLSPSDRDTAMLLSQAAVFLQAPSARAGAPSVYLPGHCSQTSKMQLHDFCDGTLESQTLS